MYISTFNRFRDYDFLKKSLSKVNIDDNVSVLNFYGIICQIKVGPVWNGDNFVYPNCVNEFQFNQVVYKMLSEYGSLMSMLRACFMCELTMNLDEISRNCSDDYANHMIDFLSERPDKRYFDVV